MVYAVLTKFGICISFLFSPFAAQLQFMRKKKEENSKLIQNSYSNILNRNKFQI